MRVALVATIRDFPWGAPGECLASLANELLDAGHDVLVMVAPIDHARSEVSELAEAGARIAVLPLPPVQHVRLKRPRDAIRRWRHGEVVRILKAWRPDHVFFNQGGTYSALSPEFFPATEFFAGRYSLICHLNHVQNPFDGARLAQARALMRNAATVYFNSRQNLALSEVQLAESIHNAAFFHYPLRFTPELIAWPVCDLPRLAMVCRIDVFHKGIDLALLALARLRDEGHAFQLTIYGEGGDVDYVRHLSLHLQLENRLVLAGFEANVRDVWRREELLLLPSRHEGCSVAMTEAMALGRPVLATMCGGASEWVDDGITGYLCPSVDSLALAQTLASALVDRERWPQLGTNAHQKIVTRRPARPSLAFLRDISPGRVSSNLRVSP